VSTSTAVAIIILVAAVLIFVRVVRRIVSVLVSVALALFGIAVSIGGTAILLNNVSISGSPGVAARVRRFVTVDWAATSEKGLGSATCEEEKQSGAAEAAAREARARNAPREREPRAVRTERRAAATASAAPSASPTAAAAAGEAEAEYYPELVRHGYPGISRAELFRLSQDTVNSLGGWKIVNPEPRTFTLQCIYTTRIFQFKDDVRITVLSNSEIDVCSRSEVGAPGSTSLLRFFPGDFGANIGHIKEFYTALEPRVDAVYKEIERKANRRRR
jgi:Protein of unknown function (DUF1499)